MIILLFYTILNVTIKWRNQFWQIIGARYLKLFIYINSFYFPILYFILIYICLIELIHCPEKAIIIINNFNIRWKIEGQAIIPNEYGEGAVGIWHWNTWSNYHFLLVYRIPCQTQFSAWWKSCRKILFDRYFINEAQFRIRNDSIGFAVVHNILHK